MKNLLLFCFIYLMTSKVNAQAQTFEIVGKDTVNMIDIHNYKTGKWVVRGHHKKHTCFKREQIIEEGNYVNNRKDGVWTEYNCNSNVRSKLTYVNGVLDGNAVFYDEKGKVIKEGAFKNNKWVKP